MKKESAVALKANGLFENGITIDCKEIREMVCRISFVENEEWLERELEVHKEKLKKNTAEQLYQETLALECSKLSIIDGVFLLRKHGFKDIYTLKKSIQDLKILHNLHNDCFNKLKKLEVLCLDNVKKLLVLNRALREVACKNTHIHFAVECINGQWLSFFQIRNGSKINYKNFYYISEEDKCEDLEIAFVKFLKFFSGNLIAATRAEVV